MNRFTLYAMALTCAVTLFMAPMAATGADTTNLPAGTITIIGAANDDVNVSGDYDYGHPINIIGAGETNTIIDGGGIDRVFHVMAAVPVTFDGVTIQNGSATNNGGGIYALGTATITNSIIANNTGGDCSGAGAWTSNGYNIDSDGTCLAFSTGTGDQTVAGFTLPALANNGGTTLTHDPTGTSPPDAVVDHLGKGVDWILADAAP